MDVELTSVSPISFMFAKQGDWVSIRGKSPNLNEFRGNLESAKQVYLVFKGQTKIGMIPTEFSEKKEFPKTLAKVRILKIDSNKKSIIVELPLNMEKK